MAGKTRGAGARRRRSARRAQNRIVQRVAEAPTPDALAEFAQIHDSLVAAPAPQESVARLLAVGEHGRDEHPAILAVSELGWAEKLAPTLAVGAPCAECDHAASEHLGESGPCQMEGCECNGYRSPNEEATVVVKVVPALELTGQPLDALFAGIPSEHATVMRARLEGFQIGRLASDPAAAVLPVEHQPGGAIPAPEPSIVPETPALELGAETEWSAVFCPEGKLTSDGRAFEPGAITWRELPLTLMAMTETSEGGHVGAEVAGRIDRIWRDSEAGLIRASGVFAATDYGSLIACAMLNVDPASIGLTASLVASETLRGVSVDLAIHDYEMGPRSNWFDEDGNWAPKPEAERAPAVDLWDVLLGDEEAPTEPVVAVIKAAEIGMTTVCPFPAFAEAKIALGDSLIAGGNLGLITVTMSGDFVVRGAPAAALTASAVPAGESSEDECGCGSDALSASGGLTAAAAGIAPVAPPASWFEKPDLDGPAALTVSDDGQVAGYAALWGVCHTGLPGCRTAPHSTTDYSYFHLGEIVCDDGSRVACGQITIDAPHAGLNLDGPQASAHYDHTGTVVAHVRVGEDEHGIWVAGALEPCASADKVRLLRGAKLSGDWRKFPGTPSQELVALLAVNVPGFPVPRARASVVASAFDGQDDEAEVYALVAAGIPPEMTDDQAEQFAALAALPEFAALASEVA